MPEPTVITDRYLRLHPELFQKAILLAVIKSHRFYVKMRPRLCPFEEHRKSRRPDFQKLEFNVIFNLVADYWDQWAGQLDHTQDYAMPLPDIEAALESEMKQARLTPGDAQAIYAMLKQDIELFDFAPSVLASLHTAPALASWLDKRAATNIVDFVYNNRLLKAPTLEGLAALINGAQSRLSSTSERLVRAGDLVFRKVAADLPFPTDIEGVNIATGGGLRPGSTTLIGGCNGSGKTTLAMQWAKHFALTGANVVVFTTEQPPEQLLVRVLSNHLQVDFNEFMTDEIDPTIPLSKRRQITTERPLIPQAIFELKQAEIYEFYQNIWPRLYFVDWSQATKVISKDFEAEINEVAETGWHPDVVIFDWIGGGLDSIRKTPNMDLKMLYTEGIETLIHHAKRTKRVMIAMAQLNKTSVGPKKKDVQMSDLAECKSMTNSVTNFIGISALRQISPTDSSMHRTKQFLNVAKATSSPGGLVPVEAIFRYQCFRYAGKGNQL